MVRKVTIDFEGTFNQFKTYRSKFDKIHPVSKEKVGSNLTFKNVLYVLFEGKPHKMFVSNASAVGVQRDDKPSFDKCQKNSMQYYTLLPKTRFHSSFRAAPSLWPQ